MTQEKFENIYQRAAERKGGEQNLERLLSEPLSQQELLSITDERWLSIFTMKVFQCGISWQVVRNKWDNFEEVFFNFDPELLLMLSDEQWEEKARNPAIIRHLTKVMTIPANAQMLINASYEHGSFSKMVANWPKDNTTGLWEYLKKNGKRLGGNTGAYALRQAGVDTFILSSDVESYLRNTKIIDSGRNTKKALQAADNAFAKWHIESGRSLTQISQIIAYSCGDNRVI
ncbi:DNA-3-methyladenine glycosylase I [Parashewanella tropica]|uniref:DNA-3-methyladenine glycosylase I n=1 Tax=Parashewanella tropica TaxID=2547970 RepID=UPI001059ABF7|nr:DNA-3-methyladenine glycosylase I [Parashewanella tropica]